MSKNIKSKMCRNLSNCTYGSRCTYAHSESELNTNISDANSRRTTAMMRIHASKKSSKSQMCSFLPNCSKGDKCTYAHCQADFPECEFGDLCRTKNSKYNKCRFNHTTSHIPAPASSTDIIEFKDKQEDDQLLNLIDQLSQTYITSSPMHTNNQVFVRAPLVAEKFIIEPESDDE